MAEPTIPISPITDPWDLLGVTRDTPVEDIKRQRNTLALATHPDKCPSPTLRPEWTQRMARVNEAFTLATDEDAWSKYKQDHRIQDEADLLAAAAAAASSSQPDSERVANAKAHQANNDPSHQAARADRKRNLQARAESVEEAFADGACSAEARDRHLAYLSQQTASNAEAPEERVAARVGRDAERAREDRRFGARAAIGTAAEMYGDAAALLVENGGGWTADDLAEESLGALDMDEGSAKQRKVARRMLVGEAVDRRDKGRLAWDEGHGGGTSGGGGAALEGGAARLRIGQGSEADEEMEMVEEERRQHARKLEQQADTKKFKDSWMGMFGNEKKVRVPARPPNRKELRQMKKLQAKST